jgi:hypothetical protein
MSLPPATVALRALRDRLRTITGLEVVTGANALHIDRATLPVAALLPIADQPDDGRLQSVNNKFFREISLELFIDADAEDFDEQLDVWIFAIRQALHVKPSVAPLDGDVLQDTAINDVQFASDPERRLATAQINLTLSYLNRYS